MMNNLPLILLMGENLFLLIALTIYLTRKCPKCQQVKCIERIFSQYCKACHKVKKAPNKEQVDI